MYVADQVEKPSKRDRFLRWRGFALSDSFIRICGAIEDIDKEAQWNFTEILEDVIGGAWDTPMSPWESRRREAMLELFGKAQPFTMVPGSSDR